MELRGVADVVGSLIQQIAKQHTLIETGAANQEVFRGPFAGVVLAPGFAQPFAIRFEAARRHDTGTRGNAPPRQPASLTLTIVHPEDTSVRHAGGSTCRTLWWSLSTSSKKT